MRPKFDAFGVPAPRVLASLAPHERMGLIIDHALPKLPGWCTPFKARRIADLVIEAARASGAGKGPLCVELGVFGGRSLIALALAVKHCLAGKGKVIGIDPYTIDAALEHVAETEHQEWWTHLDYNDIKKAAVQGINRLELAQIVSLRIQRSRDAVSAFATESIDVLHQDSNHSEHVSCQEVASWAPKMKEGGFWIFDDIQWKSTQLAQNFLISLGFERLENHGNEKDGMFGIFRAPKNCGALVPVMPILNEPEGVGYVEAVVADVEGPPLAKPPATA